VQLFLPSLSKEFSFSPSHFQLVNINPGLGSTTLPAAPGQLFVGFPCKLLTEMARAGFSSCIFALGHRMGGSGGSCIGTDGRQPLRHGEGSGHENSYINFALEALLYVLTAPSPGLSPIRRGTCQAQSRSPLANTDVDKELLSHRTEELAVPQTTRL